jgi:hypothetical protein
VADGGGEAMIIIHPTPEQSPCDPSAVLAWLATQGYRVELVDGLLAVSPAPGERITGRLARVAVAVARAVAHG